MTRIVRAITMMALLLPTSVAAGQVFQVQEMNTGQIRALDRQKTAVLLQGGPLEEHGPYLPSYTDGYINEYLASNLADAIAARPGWSVVMFPPVPLGVDTAEGLGGLRQFPGSYGVRESTLRAVFVDLATEIGEQGFRWVFLIDGHGAPAHNRALDATARYFNAHYQGRMVHLSGIADVRGRCAAVAERRLTADAAREDARSPHAGNWETSVLLSLRPDLVNSSYRTARPLPAQGWRALFSAARAEDWPGYFGSPRVASRAAGDEWLRAMTAADNSMALRVLDGFDDSSLPRYAPSVGFLFSDAFLWGIALFTALWLCVLAHAGVTLRRWVRSVRDNPPTGRQTATQLVATLAALTLSVAVLRPGTLALFPVALLLSLPPDPTYALLLLAMASILIAGIKLIVLGAAALRTLRGASAKAYGRSPSAL